MHFLPGLGFPNIYWLCQNSEDTHEHAWNNYIFITLMLSLLLNEYNIFYGTNMFLTRFYLIFCYQILYIVCWWDFMKHFAIIFSPVRYYWAQVVFTLDDYWLPFFTLCSLYKRVYPPHVPKTQLQQPCDFIVIFS